jgi:hypothetical protein
MLADLFDCRRADGSRKKRDTRLESKPYLPSRCCRKLGIKADVFLPVPVSLRLLHFPFASLPPKYRSFPSPFHPALFIAR